MSLKFKRNMMRAGLIIHVRTLKPKLGFGGMIRIMLNRGLKKLGLHRVWGNHDAITVQDFEGVIGIGESVPLCARVTTIEKYERDIAAGKIEVKVYEVIDASPMDEALAARWWIRNVCGTPYDFKAFPYLIIKAMFSGVHDRVAGWEWANFCTEGIGHAFKKGTAGDPSEAIDPYNKDMPTPLTTEKRAGEYPTTTSAITLREITKRVMYNHLPVQMII